MFILVCILLGIGVYSLSRWSSSQSADETSGLSHGASNDLGGSNLQSQDESEYSNNSSENEVPAASVEQETPAAMSDESVWTSANSGALSCVAADQSLDVRWERQGTADATTVVINGRTVIGKLVGDWQPRSNTIRYDFEGSVPAIGGTLTISDEGSLAVSNEQNGEVVRGQCERA